MIKIIIFCFIMLVVFIFALIIPEDDYRIVKLIVAIGAYINAVNAVNVLASIIS